MKKGQWNHVCATWDSDTGTAELFVNAELLASETDVMSGTYIEPGTLVLGQVFSEVVWVCLCACLCFYSCFVLASCM